jgi:hypothetical protein
MCELPLPASASVRSRRATKLICPDCHAVQTQALKELRELDRLTLPGRPDLTGVRALRGTGRADERPADLTFSVGVTATVIVVDVPR